MAATAARRAGAKVTLVSRSPGASALSPGVIDVAWPKTAAELSAQEGHPFQLLREALGEIPEAIAALAEALSPLFDRSPRDGLYCTVLGTRRRAGLVQQSQAPGVLDAGSRFAVVGLELQPGLLDERWVAESLNAAGMRATPCRVGYLQRDEDVALTSFALAARLDRPEEAERFAAALARALPPGCDRVLLPPVLGVAAAPRTLASLIERVGVPCAELLPVLPAPPGLRLARALASASSAVGATEGVLVRLEEGGAELHSGERLSFDAAVLATGRFIGGGIARRSRTAEQLAGLPVIDGLGPLRDESGPGALAGAELGAAAPLFRCGVSVEASLRALDSKRRPIPWLFAAGSVLAGADGAVDGTGLGFAAFTGWLAGKNAAAAPAGVG
jgi:glycerol-3-phosphate dehydrogenase subunit B